MSFSKFRIQLAPSHKEEHDQVHRDQESLTPVLDLTVHPSLAYLWKTKDTPSVPALPPVGSGYYGSDSDSEDETTRLIAYLKSLGDTILDLLCNQRDFLNPKLTRHIAPNFSCKKDDKRSSTTREDHFAAWIDTMKKMPLFKEEIVDRLVAIHPSGKKAKMWSFKRMYGIPARNALEDKVWTTELEDGMCKEGIGCLDWELRGDIWMCVRLHLMWGVSEFV